MRLLGTLEQRRHRKQSNSNSYNNKDISSSRSGISSTTQGTSVSSSVVTQYCGHEFALESKERAAQIVQITQQTLQGLPEHENIILDTGNNKILRLHLDELILGSTIAMGGFGCITQVHAAGLSLSKKYVMKTLVPIALAQSDEQLISAAHQLAKERYFLSQLNHPHIVSLRAMSHGQLEIIQQTQRLDSYFIIEEFLPIQLTQQIQYWHQQQIKQQRIWSSKKLMPKLFLKQVTCAMQIASALQYLHEKQRIIFRDVKPANVGLDARGHAKLFDFGLAVQLPRNCDLNAVQPFLGGSRVGTTRYMATEVLRKQPYNVKADVFSFAVLLWEMIILDQRPPEGGCGVYGSRPVLPSHWPIALKRMLQRAWADDFQHKRPHMSEVLLFLQDLERQIQSDMSR